MVEKNSEQLFLTSTQGAKLLNISLATLKKLIALGKIRTIRTPGGHYRINKKELLSSLYTSSKTNKK
jgi:excisionase family DNA binding protein